MNVAIITPGILPVPSVKGGAVETLIDYYLSENEHTHNIKFFVFSKYDEEAESKSKEYNSCNFIYFKPDSIYHKIKRYLYKKIHKNSYYNYYMDYYERWAVNKIKRLDINLIIIENRQGFTLNASKKLNAPIILHLHNDTLNRESLCASEIVKCCSKIIAVSNYIKKQVDSIDKDTNCSVVYNGIDLDRFNNTSNIYSRERFSLDDDDFVVIYTGRITHIKGIKELINAFMLLSDYPKIKLIVSGSSNFGNDDSYDSFSEEIKQMAKKVDSQIFFTGYIPYNNIPSLLSIADIGIIPSICEDALTLSSIEDMASGLPLIVTRSGGIPEAVDEKCAIIIDKDNLEDLPKLIADSIIYLFKHPEKRIEMSKHALERSKLFSKENYIKKIIQIVNSYLPTK
jgi:spore coat protein SA